MAEATDKNKEAFKAALEKKKAKANAPKNRSNASGKSGPAKSGPDASRRLFQRRSGSA
ncbi:MAG: DUF5302 family protein [Candidatus Nanopelagicales bacterium]